MAWTEDWTGAKELYDVAPYLTELQVALNERVDIANARQDQSSPISKPSFLSAAAEDFSLFSFETIVGQIQSLVDDLIPQFTNTTDADEWEGQADSIAPPMPYWSEATLLAAISESRIVLDHLDELTFPWFLQQKNILDELRWTSQQLKDISAPPAIACNSCSPSLPFDFTVALSGLTGSIWEDFQGTHTLTYTSGCTWFDSTGYLYLNWYDASNWIVNVSSLPTERDGQLRWTGPPDTCDPLDDYGSHTSCASVLASDCSGLGTTSCIVTGAAVTSGYVDGEYRQGTGANFAAAVTAWNASSYATGDGGETSECLAKESGGTYTVHRRHFEFGPTSDEDEWNLDAPTITKPFVAGSPTSTPNKTFKFYAALTAPSGGTYENNDYDGGEDEFSIFQVESTPTDTATVPTLSIGNFASITATDPGAGGEQGWKVETPFNVYMMHKWDVAGGLEKI